LSNNIRVTTSTASSQDRVDPSNIKHTAVYTSSNVSNSSILDRPWTNYYVNADEFFSILRIAFDDTYGGGSDTPWHPEDMYVNVLTTLEVVTNTLSNMANIKAGRPLKGLKEI